jgi:opacity protein-like surface antigen
MKRLLICVGVAIGICGSAAAQGVAQSPSSSSTINQQRQNGALVSPGVAIQTYPSSNTFGSPFQSPFGTSGPANLPAKGGYAGNGVNR